MIDKYLAMEIFEIENGWVIKVQYPDQVNVPNPTAYITYYCNNVDSLVDKIKEICKEK